MCKLFFLFLFDGIRKKSFKLRVDILPSPVWPDEGINSSHIVAQKVPTSDFMQIVTLISNDRKRFKIFGLLLQEIFSLRRFKNSPIWSHWPSRKADIIRLGGTTSARWTYLVEEVDLPNRPKCHSSVVVGRYKNHLIESKLGPIHGTLIGRRWTTGYASWQINYKINIEHISFLPLCVSLSDTAPVLY